jgi:glutamine amidotransferase
MSVSVAVVDYGIGNLLSVSRALEQCGAQVLLTDDPAQIAQAQRLVLPGVGAFKDGMDGLRTRGLIDILRQFAATGRPLLGICLGMQMLLDYSEEFGTHEGLGLISGRVTAIPATSAAGVRHKIPHIGWNELQAPDANKWSGTILDDIAPGSSVYFVHSFTAFPDDSACRLADCSYDGRLISAVIRKRNTYGCQFHPEKSGEIGLNILRRFLAL